MRKTAVENMQTATDALQRLAGNPDLFRKQDREDKPKLGSLVIRINNYDRAGKAFMGEFKKCPDSVKAGMEVLESALIVTVDSIITKY